MFRFFFFNDKWLNDERCQWRSSWPFWTHLFLVGFVVGFHHEVWEKCVTVFHSRCRWCRQVVFPPGLSCQPVRHLLAFTLWVGGTWTQNKKMRNAEADEPIRSQRKRIRPSGTSLLFFHTRICSLSSAGCWWWTGWREFWALERWREEESWTSDLLYSLTWVTSAIATAAVLQCVCRPLRRPVDSMREAVLTVSPKRQ